VPEVKPAEAYAYQPEPVVAPVTVPPLATPLSRPAPAGAEPVDVVASIGAKSPMRRAAPLLIVVGILMIALVVWLIVA
jgi:hypothetical protein